MKAENIYIIYKHINTINGKIYVGQTCQSPEDRWKDGGKGYRQFWVDENGVKHPSHFWASICKYGWNHFEHKVLIHGLTKSQADFWEKKLIKEWDLMNPEKGYNKKEGGSNGKHSDETKRKMSRSHKGKTHSEEHRQKISKTKKEMYASGELIAWNKGKARPELSGINNPNFGKKMSYEQKQKISKTKKEKYANGEIVAWNKGKKYPEYSGINHPNFGKHFSKETCKKISDSKIGKYIESNNPNSKSVVRLKDNKIYKYMKECLKDNNICQETLTNNCKNRLKNKPQEFMYYIDWIELNDTKTK